VFLFYQLHHFLEDMKPSFKLIFLFITPFIFQGWPTKTFAQQTRRVLFIGNSYTAGNNLPQLTSQLALSAGDTLIFDSNTPGGFTFQGHVTNAQTLSKIQAGNWDYVVLQEQSQRPSFPISQVQNDVFPYARQLDSLIHLHNPCAETMFYMTWGRKNGDASNCAVWPPVCTYNGMDSLLYERYMMMTVDNDAVVSPVGALWRYIRAQHPGIELYQADESHPSLAGSYAAACSFYAAIFRKSPLLINNNTGLSASDAQAIREAAKTVVFDSLSKWQIGNFDPVAEFIWASGGANAIDFTNQSLQADSYFWNFGDGNTSTTENPVHSYTSPGVYTVTLEANRCLYSDTISYTIDITTVGLNSNPKLSSPEIFPNPLKDELNVLLTGATNLQLFDALGRLVYQCALNPQNNLNTVELSHLPNGMYLLRINQGAEITSYRLIKE
jgi:hypothetical protein